MLNYAGKRVLVTGHTGFVGKWLTTWLEMLGADVYGVSLPQDLRLPWVASDAVIDSWAEIVFHLAAQALVGESYDDPLGTFETNVMGTVNVLDAARLSPSVKATVVITSDKCYAPSGGLHAESDPLGGNDPYSASKGAAEFIVNAYRESFGLHVATARAGNIIGGGDLAEGRIVPDCIRALRDGTTVQLRNPTAIRPWQHVLDAVYGYLVLGDALLTDPVRASGAWNFGPRYGGITVGTLVSSLSVPWERAGTSYSETSTLRIDSRKAFMLLGWEPLLSFEEMVDLTLEHYASEGDLTETQIKQFMERLP